MLNFFRRFVVLLKNMPYYAVAKGRQVGIYLEWNECFKQINGFPNAKFKKFGTKEEAEKFINEKDQQSSIAGIKTINPIPKCINYLPDIGKWKGNFTELNKQISTTIGKLYLLGPENINQKHIPLINSLENAYEKLCEASKGFNNQAILFLEGIDPSNQDKINIKSKNVNKDNVPSVEGPKAKKRKLNNEINIDESASNGYTIVYTDGACENNGKKGARAGIGVWFGDGSPMNISKSVDGRHTNNTAEIQAISEAIKTAKLNGIMKLEIRTDSQFVINCMTKWIYKWKKNNWKTSTGEDVKNKQDLIDLDQNLKNIIIKWTHVRGHQGLHGNEEADRLAREGAKK